MTAGKKKPDEKDPETPASERTLRNDAEEQLARSPKRSADLKGQTPEQLIHELQVHQIELETQAEELRRAHIALEESRDRYLNLYEFAPLGYLLLTEKALITDINLTGAALLGVDRNKLVNSPFSKYISEKDSDLWHRYFMNILHQVEKVTCHLLLMTRENGSVFPAQLEGIRTTDNRGGTTVRIAINDITDIRQVEEALEESEERFRFAMRYLPGTLWTVDTNMCFSLSQGSGLAALGLKPNQVVGKSLYDFFKTMDPGDTAINAHQRALHGEIVTYEYVHQERIFKTIVAPMRESQGQVTGVVGIALDITSIRRAEEALHKSNKKIHHLASVTRHDINNQLTVLRGYLTLLEKKQHDPTLNEYFLKVSTATERISAMIRFTKEYEQIGVKDPVWQNCKELVDTTIKETPAGQVKMNNELPADAEVYADPLLAKVFYNLVDNAVRYGGKITALRFAIEEHVGEQIIVCEDDGDGILAEEKEKIFDRGFGKNTGLGLFLSRELLDITGITIRETGEPGRGARFEITVPVGAYRFGV